MQTGETGRTCINYGFQAHPTFEILFTILVSIVSAFSSYRTFLLTRDFLTANDNVSRRQSDEDG